MIEPNFGESQLQQCVNTEFTLWALNTRREFVSPVVPTLREEDRLGYDTGFFFPWLAYPPIIAHRGCNLFIQYKLSSLIEGKRGAQYAHWREPYFRFAIPHHTKTNGRYVKDFHQFDALRALAQSDCEVYYATNQVTTRDELVALAAHRSLLDNTPFLDVREITQHHDNVTFTASSDSFLLHSEPEEIRRLSSEGIRGRILQKEVRSLEADNEQLYSILLEQLSDAQGRDEFRRVFDDMGNINAGPVAYRTYRKFFFLGGALLRFFDIWLVRFLRIDG